MPKPPIIDRIRWDSVFASAMTYEEWLAKGESEENCLRIEQSRKNLILDSETAERLLNVPRLVNILVIAEDWCGDVVRHVPVLEKLVGAGPNLKTRYITREQNTEVFVRYLTNGGEAIPKFIFFNNQFVECGNWGPMPENCRDIISQGKACDDVKTARKKVAALYGCDENFGIVITELCRLLEIATCVSI